MKKIFSIYFCSVNSIYPKYTIRKHTFVSPIYTNLYIFFSFFYCDHNLYIKKKKTNYLFSIKSIISYNINLSLFFFIIQYENKKLLIIKIKTCVIRLYVATRGDIFFENIQKKFRTM